MPDTDGFGYPLTLKFVRYKEHDMKYYIVWFNDDYEQAEEAAELVQDITLPWLPGQNAQDTLAKYLVSKGHPANAIRNIQPVGRFMHDINNVEIGPSRCFCKFLFSTYCK